MAKKDLPTPEMLRNLLRYEPHTGKLFWRKRDPEHFLNGAYSKERKCRAWNAKNSEKEAFTAIDAQGYLHGTINGRLFRAHRVAWAIETGDWPENQIDHINGNRSDNRIRNLRQATPSQNMRNKGLQKNNTSGFKGVSFDKRDCKFWATISINGKPKKIGCFMTAEEAHAAYCSAAKFHYREFANFGVNKT